MRYIYISISVAILVSCGCSPHLVSGTMISSKGLNEYTLAGVKYFLHLPADMGLNPNFKSAETSSCSYTFFVRRPFTPGSMMEERYANQLIVTYFTDKQYQGLRQSDGATFFPDLYAFTIDKIHPEVTSYKLPEGRGAILRYDVRDAEGIFCLTAVVLDGKKPGSVFNTDVELMKEALKSFRVSENRARKPEEAR